MGWESHMQEHHQQHHQPDEWQGILPLFPLIQHCCHAAGNCSSKPDRKGLPNMSFAQLWFVCAQLSDFNIFVICLSCRSMTQEHHHWLPRQQAIPCNTRAQTPNVKATGCEPKGSKPIGLCQRIDWRADATHRSPDQVRADHLDPGIVAHIHGSLFERALIAQESNKASSQMMQLKCLHNATVTSCRPLHAIRTSFILDHTARAVVETTVIDKHTSGTPIIHTEASFTSADRGLCRGTLSRTSLKHCIWFWFILSMWSSFASNSKGLQLSAQCTNVAKSPWHRSFHRLLLLIACTRTGRWAQRIDRIFAEKNTHHLRPEKKNQEPHQSFRQPSFHHCQNVLSNSIDWPTTAVWPTKLLEQLAPCNMLATHHQQASMTTTGLLRSESELVFCRVGVSWVTEEIDLSKIFFLEHSRWFWDQWKYGLPVCSKVFGHSNFHG